MSSGTVINNKLSALIVSGKSDILNIYCTAGYPKLDDTSRVLKALEEAGADIIELGMPFSDPLADGPVIQASSMQALDNGMSIELLFEQLRGVNIAVPIVLMGYLNPVLQYGIERFVSACVECGIAGVIIPDLPPSLYTVKYKELFESRGLCNICLVTPQTSPNRIRDIDKVCTGFIYAVSSASTTGTKSELSNIDDYLWGLSEMGLKNPVLTGFNIKDADSFTRAIKYTRGGIIGSAFIKAIADANDLESAIHSFVKSIRS